MKRTARDRWIAGGHNARALGNHVLVREIALNGSKLNLPLLADDERFSAAYLSARATSRRTSLRRMQPNGA
jgi:hypothetical protein